MSGRRTLTIGLAAAGAVLAIAPARADVRIEERATSLESRITRWTHVKGDRRSIVTRADVGGVLYNAGAKHGAYVEVARPDKELIWEIDPQERTFREVRFTEFSKLLQRGVQAPTGAVQQPLRSLYNAETTAIEVVPTGKRKSIAGFDAEQVIARAVVGATNLQTGRQFSFTFDQEIWLTKEDRLLKELRPFEEKYVETFGSAATLQQARVMAGEWNDAFINHLRAMNDRVRALGGFILSSTTYVTEQALAQSKEEKSTARRLLVSSSEVRKITLDPIPDSEFEIPAGFLNADTRVATSSPAPAAPADSKPTPSQPTPTPSQPSAVAAAPAQAAPATASPAAPGAAPAPSPSPARPVTASTSTPTASTPPPAQAKPASTPVKSTPAYGRATVPSQGAVPVPFSYTKTPAPPPPVTVDEPETGKKKKRKFKLPF